jgi:hypothetical protein
MSVWQAVRHVVLSGSVVPDSSCTCGFLAAITPEDGVHAHWARRQKESFSNQSVPLPVFPDARE